jgi:hypothetical protein
MANKSPKTFRGMVRKMETGDGRKSTAMENVMKETDESMKKSMREMNKAIGGTSTGKKKKQAKKKK